MIRTEEKRSFAHYGTPRHSGRYPWGSVVLKVLVIESFLIG